MDKKDKQELPAREGKFSYEAVEDAASLVKYLQALTDGFASGSMRFSRKDLDMELCPKGLIGFAVEAKEPKNDTLSIVPGADGEKV